MRRGLVIMQIKVDNEEFLLLEKQFDNISI